MHDNPLPQCEQRWKDVDRHMTDSLPVRTAVDKSCQQILTLERAHEATMSDIREMKDDIKVIRNDIWGLKVFILCSAISGLVSLLGVSVYYGGDKRHIEINTKRLDKIEAVFLPITLKHTSVSE
jgi:hypothetical protein